MNTVTRPAAIAPLPVDRGSRRLSVTAGIGYLLSWLVGLLVFSSSTQVRSSGAQVLHSYTGHQSAVALQYVLTEGLPAMFLAAVVWTLARTIAARAARARQVVLAAGLAAAAVSLVQLTLGLWLSTGLVDERATSTAGAVFDVLTRLDGIKMLLIAMLAVAAARAIRRRDVQLPAWLAHLAAALAVMITLSAIGYLALDNTLAAAAWASLPCLLVFITLTGITLHRRPTRQALRRSERYDPARSSG